MASLRIWEGRMALPLAAATILISLVLSAARDAGRPPVGGWMDVGDVKQNEEVQGLGRFAVSEFNRRQQEEQEARGGPLWFSEVLEARKQVASGMRYFLKISATNGEEPRMFHAMVMVKPWLQYKELLDFVESSD